MLTVNVKNNYTNPLQLPRENVTIPVGESRKVHNWEKKESHPVIQAWIRANVISVSEVDEDDLDEGGPTFQDALDELNARLATEKAAAEAGENDPTKIAVISEGLAPVEPSTVVPPVVPETPALVAPVAPVAPVEPAAVAPVEPVAPAPKNPFAKTKK